MRMNGERPQEYNARRAFQVESAIATAAYNTERRIKIAEGLPLPVVHVDLPCTCPKFAFGHFHEQEEQRREVARFRRRFAPLYGADGKLLDSSSRRIDYFASDKHGL
ncbi:MAG TPA: hypothetical protein VKW06_10520 [Candidatus Angelobacter sp.]|nr:hypothetical protein [Candidatus Angelobacter sp.]